MTYERPTTNPCGRGFLYWRTLLSCLFACTSTQAQVFFDHQCSTSDTHAYYLNQLERTPIEDIQREGALETLLCIALHDESDIPMGVRAVRTLYALARSDDEARRLLLEIALDPTVSLDVQTKSCRLLTWIADPETIEAIRSHLFSTWPNGDLMNYVTLLRDIGDTKLLPWLEARIAEMESRLPMREFWEQIAKRIRIQATPERLLDELRAGDCSFDCSWYALQALRHGIEPDLVHKAVLEVLQNPAGGKHRGSTSLFEDCRDAGILTPQDVRRFPEYTRMLKRLMRGNVEQPSSWVAEGIAAKRAEFYRIPPWRDGHSGE